MRLRWLPVVCLLALGIAAPVRAGTLLVKMDGADDPACGGKGAPCRTITQALANASPGDTILVGPGRYGDLNGYPFDLGGPGPVDGEENDGGTPACNCYVHVDKPITLLSERGATATVLHGGSDWGTNGCEAGGPPYANATDVIRIDADQVTIGAPGKGFTIVGGCNAIYIPRPDSKERHDIVIAGNAMLGNQRSDIEFKNDTFCRGCVLQGNLSAGNGRRHTNNQITFFLDEPEIAGNAWIANDGPNSTDTVWFFSTSGTVRDNLAMANERQGFPSTKGKVTGNVATLNRGAGFWRAGGKVSGNFATANRVGFNQFSGELTKNSAIGNAAAGIDDNGSHFTKGNLYGNGFGLPSVFPETNCGAESATGVPNLSGNFWGHPTGPGADPADLNCGTGDPGKPATKPVKPKRFKRKPAL